MRIEDAADSEFAVIACIVRGGSYTAAQVARHVTSDSFCLTTRLSTAYRVVSRLAAGGDAITPDVLRNSLWEGYRDDWEADFAAYIPEWVSGDLRRFYTDVRDARGWEFHARRVAAASQMVRARVAISELSAQAADWEGDPAEFVAEAQRKLLTLSLATQQARPSAVSETLPAWYADFKARYDSPSVLRGLDTGFGRLNRMTRGLCPGHLVIVAGQSGDGKSALATCLAINAARLSGAAVVLFSLEMEQEEILERMMFIESRVDSQRYLDKQLEPHEWEALDAAYHRLRARKIHVEDDANVTVAKIASVCRQRKFENACDLVLVDYTQLVSPDRETARDGGNREREVAKIAEDLKRLASELKVPVVALSQLNDDGRVRESRAIKQHANILLKISHPNQDAAPPPGVSGLDSRPCVIEVEKCRRGRVGLVPARFTPSLTRFDEEVDADVYGTF